MEMFNDNGSTMLARVDRVIVLYLCKQVFSKPIWFCVAWLFRCYQLLITSVSLELLVQYIRPRVTGYNIFYIFALLRKSISIVFSAVFLRQMSAVAFLWDQSTCSLSKTVCLYKPDCQVKGIFFNSFELDFACLASVSMWFVSNERALHAFRSLTSSLV